MRIIKYISVFFLLSVFLTQIASGLEFDVSESLSPYLPDGIDGEISSLADDTANGNIVSRIKKAVSDAFPDIKGAFGALLCAVLLSGIAAAVSSSLGADEDVLSLAGTLVCAVLIFNVIKTAFDALHTALLASVTFMTALMGIMCYVYGIMGNIGSLGVSASVLSAVLQTVEMVSSYILFPLICTVFGLTLAGCLKGVGELSQIASSVKKIAVFILSSCAMAVTLAFGLCGVFASVSDGVLKRSVKFAAGSFVPIIGSSLAEAYDAVFTSISVIKATAGGGGIGALLLIFLPPLVTLCAVKLMLMSVGLVCRTLGLSSQAKLASGCSDILSLMIAVCCFSFVVMTAACAVFMRVNIH